MESALLLAECEINSPPPELDPLRYLPLRNGSVIDLERCLTVKDIFELDLRQCRMAVLSACETGFSDIRSSTDEYVGLPSAFLFAGTRTVVSSLWAVSDLATALLMVRFYELLKDQKNPSTYLCPRVSLHQAQIWLRDSTAGELTYWVQRMPLSGSGLSLLAYLSKIDREVQPFSQPQFWAAFCAIGF
jgi:CHAT domain-containing protein